MALLSPGQPRIHTDRQLTQPSSLMNLLMSASVTVRKRGHPALGVQDSTHRHPDHARAAVRTAAATPSTRVRRRPTGNDAAYQTGWLDGVRISIVYASQLIKCQPLR